MKHKSEIGNSLGIPSSTVWSNDLVDEKRWEEDIDAFKMWCDCHRGNNSVIIFKKYFISIY